MRGVFLVMRTIEMLAVMVLLPALTGMAAAEPLVLVKDGKSEYRIVISRSATIEVRKAADELQSFIEQISGAELEIVDDTTQPVAKEIVLGNNRRLKAIRANIDFEKLGKEGFTIRTVGKRLVIAGGPCRGTIYGVYTFLEEQLGCRWYAVKCTYVPKKPDIAIQNLDITQVPRLGYRNLCHYEAWDVDWALRMKVDNVIQPKPMDDASKGTASGNGWCHMTFSYIHPDKYFKDHPEYFAMWNGKREPAQLCYSNPDVLKIVVQEIKQRIKEHPEFAYWDCSQMDNEKYCTCDKCKEGIDREGSPMGMQLTFVNKVAEQIPERKITSHAYWETFKPPKFIRPAKNVNIMVCYDWSPIEPLPSYYKAWVKIAPNRYFWHYVINAGNEVAPWPNLRMLQKQFKTIIDDGAKGVFVENACSKGSEFAELRGYLIAKLLWNPDIDAEAVIDDFLNGFYGPAAPHIRKYIDTMYDCVIATGAQLDTHHWCRHHAHDFLAPEMLAKYDAIFDDAQKAVANDPVLWLRVRHARMPLMVAALQTGYGSIDQRIDYCNTLMKLAKQFDMPSFSDGDLLQVDRYIGGIKADLEKQKAGQQ